MLLLLLPSIMAVGAPADAPTLEQLLEEPGTTDALIDASLIDPIDQPIWFPVRTDAIGLRIAGVVRWRDDPPRRGVSWRISLGLSVAFDALLTPPSTGMRLPKQERLRRAQCLRVGALPISRRARRERQAALGCGGPR